MGSPSGARGTAAAPGVLPALRPTGTQALAPSSSPAGSRVLDGIPTGSPRALTFSLRLGCFGCSATPRLGVAQPPSARCSGWLGYPRSGGGRAPAGARSGVAGGEGARFAHAPVRCPLGSPYGASAVRAWPVQSTGTRCLTVEERFDPRFAGPVL